MRAPGRLLRWQMPGTWTQRRLPGGGDAAGLGQAGMRLCRRGRVHLPLPACHPHRQSAGSVHPSQNLSGLHRRSLTHDPSSPRPLYCRTSKCCCFTESMGSSVLAPWTPVSKSFLSVFLDPLSLLSQICPSVFCPVCRGDHALHAVCPLLTGSWGRDGGLQMFYPGSPVLPPVSAASGGRQGQKLPPQPSLPPCLSHTHGFIAKGRTHPVLDPSLSLCPTSAIFVSYSSSLE